MTDEPFVTSAAVADLFRLMAERPVPRAAVAARLREAFADDPNVAHTDRLLAYAFDGAPFDWGAVAVDAVDGIWAEQLKGFRASVATIDGRLRVRGSMPVHHAGRDLDPVATVHQRRATLLLAVNCAAHLAVEPRGTLAVVSSVRDEGLSLLEWVAHYRVLGVDALFVYTNDNIDGSERLLEALAAHGVVQLIHNELGPDVVPQHKCYHHALHCLTALRDYRWAFFADADEFLVPASRYHYSLPALLLDAERSAGENLAAVCVHWRWIGSGRAFGRTEGLLMERFRQASRNEHVKSIVRLRDAVSMHVVHVPTLPPGRFGVTSGFRRCERLAPEMPTDYDGGALDHYWNKSFEEFVFKHMRGDGSRDSSSAQKTFQTFFDWGQKPRPDRPVDLALATRIRHEMQHLLHLPGVAEARHHVERQFAEALANYDRQFDLRRIYDDLHPGA